jgi:phenylalanyl-tRNA synthetase beta chain
LQRARVESAPQAAPYLHPRGAAQIWVGDRKIGQFGPVHPDVIDKLELGGPALVIELDLEILEEIGKAVPSFEPVPRLPAVTRDVSLVVGDQVLAGDIEQALRESGSELCESVRVVGLFRGGSVPTGQQSLTFRMVYRDPKARTASSNARTLTDAEVDAAQTHALQVAQARFGATLRG